MVGEEFGSYKIVRKLGEGGMGEVYLARHVFMDRPAAIKVLLPELSSNKDIVGRFFAEARATELIKHPNIVQIFDCAIHPASGRGYLVMEFLDGESLGARLARTGTLEPAEVADIAHDTASALQAAHEAGIVHRDLKPDNVFLAKPTAGQRGSSRPLVKVLDFGIAKLAYPGSVSKTATGSILGTPLYMSPEQGRGLAKVDFRSDIYSLGCIIFEMLCGRPPFVREAPGDLIIAHATEAPPRMSTLVDGVPPDLEHPSSERLLEKASGRSAAIDGRGDGGLAADPADELHSRGSMPRAACRRPPGGCAVRSARRCGRISGAAGRHVCLPTIPYSAPSTPSAAPNCSPQMTSLAMLERASTRRVVRAASPTPPSAPPRRSPFRSRMEVRRVGVRCPRCSASFSPLALA